MKSILLLAGVTAILAGLAGIGCVVEAGIDPGVGGGTGCEPALCGDALFQGIPAGAPLCDAVSDAAYGDLVSCACGAGGACAVECGDNLCSDLGETGECGDCLNALCGPEHDTCANN